MIPQGDLRYFVISIKVLCDLLISLLSDLLISLLGELAAGNLNVLPFLT
jgi:hypothetical protein